MKNINSLIDDHCIPIRRSLNTSVYDSVNSSIRYYHLDYLWIDVGYTVSNYVDNPIRNIIKDKL